MINRILVSPDGQEVVVVTDKGIVVGDPHEEYGEFVQVDHVLDDWTEVFHRG